MSNLYELRRKAVIQHLGLDAEDAAEVYDDEDNRFLPVDSPDGDCFAFCSPGNGTYLALTDDEADKMAAEHIKESLYAFKPDFLEWNTGVPAAAFKGLQESGFEDSNDDIRAIIDKCGDLDLLIHDAITADGRGHFTSDYSGDEHEVFVDGVRDMDHLVYVCQIDG